MKYITAKINDYCAIYVNIWFIYQCIGTRYLVTGNLQVNKFIKFINLKLQTCIHEHTCRGDSVTLHWTRFYRFDICLSLSTNLVQSRTYFISRTYLYIHIKIHIKVQYFTRPRAITKTGISVAKEKFSKTVNWKPYDYSLATKFLYTIVSETT